MISNSILAIICIVLYTLSNVPEIEGIDGSEFFLQHPISQSVTLNSTFTLACRIRESLFQNTGSSSQAPSVQWILNQFGLGTTREDVKASGMESDSSISRYDLPYSLAEGQISTPY